MPTVSECPNREVLERLLLGKVAHPEAEVLEAHLVDCTQCARALQGLNAEDGLVAAMRQARDQTAEATAEAAEALMPWLKRLQRKDVTQGQQLKPQDCRSKRQKCTERTSAAVLAGAGGKISSRRPF